MNTEIIAFWLRDVYARVEARPLTHLEGPASVSNDSEMIAAREFKKGFQRNHLFVRGNDLMRYLWSHPEVAHKKVTITFVIPGLRSIYWDDKAKFVPDAQFDLQAAIRDAPAKFHDLYEYASLADDETLTNMSQFQLIGTITPFDVVHVPIEAYLEAVRDDAPIEVQTSLVNFKFDFKAYDFWDGAEGRLITQIE